MQNTTSQVLYKYWNEIRGTRVAPRRFEVEPARFAGILPETFVVECETGEGHRFRLAGTRIGERLGFELRGREFRDLFDSKDPLDFRRFLDSITGQGAVGVITLDMPAASGRTARFEMVLLPLIHTEDRITRLLGALSTCDHEPWLGSEPLLPGRLVSRGIIWPDGRPHAVAERMVQPSPFKQDFTLSRIVRSRRRLFRVYDGGR
jgi:hypothetical protein